MSKTKKAVVSMNCVFPIMRSVATGRSKRRWEYNIKMDLEDTRCNDSDSILLDSDSKKSRTLVNTTVNLEFNKRIDISWNN
jgi:hypothetical protein